MSSVALLIVANAPVRTQTAEEQERSYAARRWSKTKESFDLYGLHFDSDNATIHRACGLLEGSDRFKRRKQK